MTMIVLMVFDVYKYYDNSYDDNDGDDDDDDDDYDDKWLMFHGLWSRSNRWWLCRTR